MKQFFEHAWERLIKGGAALLGFVSGLYGGWDMAMQVLVICMGVDYVSGCIVAAMGKSPKTEGGGLSSSAGLHGLLRKGMMMLVVLIAALLDRALGSEGAVFRSAACWFYIANECLSILENSSLAGVPWPKKLVQMLEQMREKGEE